LAPRGIAESERQRELDPAPWISLGRGAMDHWWGTHWEKCPTFPHITTCPQSLLISATGAEILPVLLT